MADGLGAYLLGVGVHEAGVDLRLLILERGVAREDEAVRERLLHVRVAPAVVHHQALHQPRLGRVPVLHRHDLHHVQVELLVGLLDTADRVDDDIGDEVGELGVELGAEGGGGDLDQERAVVHRHVLLDRVEELEDARLGRLDPLANEPRVQPVGEVALGLLHEVADDEDVGGGPIARHVVLRRRDPRDQARGRVLDHHLVQQRVAILGQLEIPRAADEHLERALGPKVGLEHVVQPARSVHVHHRRVRMADQVRVRVHHLNGRHAGGALRSEREATASAGAVGTVRGCTRTVVEAAPHRQAQGHQLTDRPVFARTALPPDFYRMRSSLRRVRPGDGEACVRRSDFNHPC
jgi:hypothetical protein